MVWLWGGIVATVDRASVNWKPICASDISSLCNVIIAATVSDECLRFEVLETERMITIEVVGVEE